MRNYLPTAGFLYRPELKCRRQRLCPLILVGRPLVRHL